MGCTSDLIGDYDYCQKKENKMNYTREQAEEVLKDYNEFTACGRKLLGTNLKFLYQKFGVKFEVGKWYKSPIFKSAILYQGEIDGCVGMFNDIWATSWSIEDFYIEMTNEEVIDVLIEEAKKRYNEGDIVKGLWSGMNRQIKRFGCSLDNEHFYISGISVLDLKTGEWAEVIKNDPVKEQIEKLEKELETLKNKYNEQKQ